MNKNTTTSTKKIERSLTRQQRMQRKFKTFCLEEIEEYFDFEASPSGMGTSIEASLRLRRDKHREFWFGRVSDMVTSRITMSNRFLVDLPEREFNKEFRPMIRETVKNTIDMLFIWSDIARQKLSFKEIIGLENTEQRMAALKIYGVEKMIEETNAKLIDTSERGNELYLIEKIFRTPAYFLKYKDPSTDETYFSGIDPAIFEGKSKNEIKADTAMSWKFGWNLEVYNQLKIEG